MERILLMEGYDPATVPDVVFVRQGAKVAFLRGRDRLHESLGENTQVVESLNDLEMIEERTSDGRTRKVVKDGEWYVEGVFQRSDVKNANGRTYGRKLWDRLIADEASYVQKNVHEKAMVGHIEHPSDGRTDGNKAAMLTTLLEMKPDGSVFGRAKLLNTPPGLHLQALTADGVRWGVSSRGNGTVDSSGKVNESDYVLTTFDAVMAPSTPGAYPKPVKENGGVPAPVSEKMERVSSASGSFAVPTDIRDALLKAGYLETDPDGAIALNGRYSKSDVVAMIDHWDVWGPRVKKMAAAARESADAIDTVSIEEGKATVKAADAKIGSRVSHNGKTWMVINILPNGQLGLTRIGRQDDPAAGAYITIARDKINEGKGAAFRVVIGLAKGEKLDANEMRSAVSGILHQKGAKVLKVDSPGPADFWAKCQFDSGSGDNAERLAAIKAAFEKFPGVEKVQIVVNESDDEPDEPEESDITTEDDEHWYQDGKLYYTGNRAGLKKKMDRDQFWPNVWVISDHGNSILISGARNWWKESIQLECVGCKHRFEADPDKVGPACPKCGGHDYDLTETSQFQGAQALSEDAESLTSAVQRLAESRVEEMDASQTAALTRDLLLQYRQAAGMAASEALPPGKVNEVQNLLTLLLDRAQRRTQALVEDAMAHSLSSAVDGAEDARGAAFIRVVERLQERLTQAASEIADLHGQITALTQERDTLLVECDAVSQRERKALSNAATLEEEMANLRQQLQRSREYIAEATAQPEQSPVQVAVSEVLGDNPALREFQSLLESAVTPQRVQELAVQVQEVLAARHAGRGSPVAPPVVPTGLLVESDPNTRTQKASTPSRGAKAAGAALRQITEHHTGRA